VKREKAEDEEKQGGSDAWLAIVYICSVRYIRNQKWACMSGAMYDSFFYPIDSIKLPWRAGARGDGCKDTLRSQVGLSAN